MSSLDTYRLGDLRPRTFIARVPVLHGFAFTEGPVACARPCASMTNKSRTHNQHLIVIQRCTKDTETTGSYLETLNRGDAGDRKLVTLAVEQVQCV